MPILSRWFSAQAEAGNVKVVRGLWNDGFLRVLENFPADKHDDEVGALSGAHGVLCKPSGAWGAADIAEVEASEAAFESADPFGLFHDSRREFGTRLSREDF